MEECISRHSVYCYISTKAACDPCRTIYLCPSAAWAASLKRAEQFALQSGWQALAEESGSVLVVPVISGQWKEESKSLLMDIYRETRNQFLSRSKKAVWGRSGRLWCWETMLYAVGYDDGAVFTGNVLVQHPNMFAAVVLVNGTPEDYSPADHPSNHWLVPEVSSGYHVKNRDIPVHLWILEKNSQRAEYARDYFCQSYGLRETSETETKGWRGQITASKENPANQTRVLMGDFCWRNQYLNQRIMTECFEHVIRWKNSPDGTLALTDSRKEFYENPRFLRRTISVGNVTYEYFVHLPEGKAEEECKKLPLVFTVHGRGEPAWLFTTKNGWDALADKTGEFILVSPDSPGNIWFLPRDGQLFPQIVRDMEREFQIDVSRVYLTGFSNGGMMVRETAVSYPQLFAGVSPWNAPVGNTGAMMKEDTNRMQPEFDMEFTSVLQAFRESGYEMPCAFFFGDQDGAAKAEKDLMLQPMLEANGCVDMERSDEGRFAKVSYKNREGKTRVTVTIMKDMPHGAVYEESRLAWNFLKHFRREEKRCKIEEYVL